MPKSGTPSGNSNITDALDELLGIITGGAEKEEHLLKQISSKLNKSTLGKMISETAEPQMEFLATSANMLVAIAGYLYGDKGVSIGTEAGALTGKIKNNSPILGDKPMAEQLAEAGGGSGKSDKALEIEIALTGIDDKGLDALHKVLESIKEAAGVDEFEDVDVIVEMASFLTTLTDKIGNVKFDKFDKNFLDQVLNFTVSLEAVLDIAKNVSKKMPYLLLLTLFEDTIKNFPRVVAEMVSGNNGKGGLIMIMNRINKAESEGLDPKILTSFFEETTVLLQALGKLGMAATIASSLGENIRPAVDKMVEIVQQLDGLKLPNIKGSVANLKKIADVITALRDVCIGLAICALTALPALLGAIILPFVIKALDKTVEAVESLLDRLSKKKEFNVNLKQLCMTVLVIGVIMLVAALVGGLLMQNIKNILGFALVLTAFITMIMLPFALIDFLFGKNGGKMIDSMSKLSMIIVTCAVVMMIGALFMLTGLWKEALKFGATLMGFMLMIVVPLALLSIVARSAMKAAKEMCYLIVTCALVMMLGAAFMLSGLWKESLEFGAILTAFMFMVLTPFLLFNGKKLRDLAKAGNAITKIIITCAAVLIIGAIFIMLGWAVPAIEFGTILGVFIWLVVTPFGIFGKKLQKAGPALWALMGLIIASAVVLMIGAEYIRKFGAEDAIIFAVLLAGFVGIMGGIAVVLGKFKKDLLVGSAAMAIIVAISFFFAVTLEKIAEAMSIADPTDILIGVGIIVLIMLAIGGLVVAAGVLAMPPQGLFFWAGLGAMAAISGIAVMFSVAMKNIAIAAKLIAEATNEGFDTTGALNIVAGMVSIGQSVGAAALVLPVWAIMAVSIACTSMAIMISKIGKAVNDVANLKVAEDWDKDGNPTSYRQLGKQDFINAAINTSLIITILGRTVADLYVDYPDLFQAPKIVESGGFLGLRKTVKEGKTPFEKVTQACSTLGTMITLIASGVKDFADMKVAESWSSDGTPTKFRKLTNKDFAMAAVNISLIITTIGYAIAQIYTDHKELFELPPIVERGWFGRKKVRPNPGKTPFEKVTQACSTMGSMISEIAKGVRDFATMQIATKWSSDGTPIEYRQLTDGEIKNAIKNIRRTILTIFDALMTVYNWDPAFFDIKIEWENGVITAKNPVYSVIRAGTLAGRMVSSLAQGVSDVANLKVATKWNKDGVPIDYRYLNDKDFEAYAVNVRKILFATLSALAAAYACAPEMFETRREGLFWFWPDKSPIQKVINAARGGGELVSELAGGVQSILDLHLTDENGKKIPIQLKDMMRGGKLFKIVRLITTGLINALNDAYDGTPSGVTDHMEWLRNVTKDPVMPIIENIAELHTKLTETFKSTDTKKIQDIIKFAGTIPIWTITFFGTEFKDGTHGNMCYMRERIKDCVIPIVERVKELEELLLKDFNLGDKDKVIDAVARYGWLPKGLIEPFGSIKKDAIKNFSKTVEPKNMIGLGVLVRTINSLDTTKTDKFIELVGELKELSAQFSDMSQFVDALNGKINETLAHLSDKLGDAATTIKQSEKAQDKRQKLIEKNTKNLEKILDKPMKLEISKAKSSTAGGGSSSGGGSKSGSTSTPSQQNQQTGGGSGSSADISRLVTAINSLVTALQGKKIVP